MPSTSPSASSPTARITVKSEGSEIPHFRESGGAPPGTIYTTLNPLAGETKQAERAEYAGVAD